MLVPWGGEGGAKFSTQVRPAHRTCRHTFKHSNNLPVEAHFQLKKEDQEPNAFWSAESIVQNIAWMFAFSGWPVVVASIASLRIDRAPMSISRSSNITERARERENIFKERATGVMIAITIRGHHHHHARTLDSVHQWRYCVHTRQLFSPMHHYHPKKRFSMTLFTWRVAWAFNRTKC